MQEQIKNWKIKYANIKETNKNDIADMNKNYTDKLISGEDLYFNNEEKFKQTIECNENTIWELKHNGDLHQKQIYDLLNESKLKKENIKDAEEQLSHIAKEINNEKEMILQEDLRQSNCINDHINNQADMIDIHNRMLDDLAHKIENLEERKIIHNEQADKKEQYLNKDNDDVICKIVDIEKRHQYETIYQYNHNSVKLISKENELTKLNNSNKD